MADRLCGGGISTPTFHSSEKEEVNQRVAGF
jgi:hypothetical protein